MNQNDDKSRASLNSDQASTEESLKEAQERLRLAEEELTAARAQLECLQSGFCSQSGPHVQSGTYPQNGPYAQSNPYAQNSPHSQSGAYTHNSYAQAGFYAQTSPFGQANPYAQGMPNTQSAFFQGAPYTQPNTQPNYYSQVPQQPIVAKDHVAAGLLAIFLGVFGVHKFYLGYNTVGFVMLAVSILGSIFTLGIAAVVIWVIAVVEGVLYLTKTQSDFDATYVAKKKEWF